MSGKITRALAAIVRIIGVHDARKPHHKTTEATMSYNEDEQFPKVTIPEEVIEKAKDLFRTFNYPITDSLIEKLKAEYRVNAEKKGDSWSDCSIEFLRAKLHEEFNEVHRAFFYGEGDRAEELIDLILVAAMLHERIT